MKLTTTKAILESAIAHREAGRFADAINILTDGLAKFANSAEILSLLSHCYILQNDEEKAAVYLKKAKEIDSNNRSVRWNEARQYLNQSKLPEALSTAKNTAERFPDDIEGMLVLGVCLRANKEIAVSFFTKQVAVKLIYGTA